MTPFRCPAPLVLLAFAAALLTGCGKGEQEYANSTLRAIDRSHASGARGDLQAISIAITGFVTAEGDIPQASDIHALADQLEPTYQRVIKRTDPWGTDYGYSASGSSYELSSAGYDKTWDTEDDLIVEDGQVTKMPAGFDTKL